MFDDVRSKLSKFTDGQLSDLFIEANARVRAGGSEAHRELLRLIIEESASRPEVPILSIACFSCGIDPEGGA